jgi:predicted TIM-barrel fold metal-dependent hydrolase
VLVDVHSHLMSLAFVRHLQGRPVWPVTRVEGDLFVTDCAPDLSIRHGAPILEVEHKLRDMDADGIDVAVLSHGLPGPDLLGGEEADVWASRINDELAGIVATHPDRFAAWGSLGFGDPGRTIAEVDRCLDELGFRGLQVWSNVNGRPLDAPAVLPVLEHIVERGAPVHLHPSVPLNRVGMDSAGLLLAMAFPLDSSLAVVRLVRQGLFDRRPAPRMVVAHLAGVLPWLADRLTIYLGPTDQFSGGGGPPFASYLERLHVDTVTYGLDQLEQAYRRLGAARMLFGSDHPFARPREPRRLLDLLPCGAADRELIRCGNACELLGLQSGVAPPSGAGRPRPDRGN